MRAAKAVVEHFTSVPSVTKAGGAEKAMMAVSPNFWKGVAKELFTKEGDQDSAVTAKFPVKPRRRPADTSVGARMDARNAGRMESAGLQGGGGGGYVTLRGGRMSGGEEDD